MRSGVLVYQTNQAINIFNIGDYIQSLAAMQFLDTNNLVYVNREKLDQYAGDKINLILNGWFMHSPMNWPPSPQINPLFVAFHLNKLVKDELLTREDSLAYFRQHQPIGCRDRYTARLMQEKGIDAYFSGCLTLTLGNTYKSAEKDNTIYFVDALAIPGLTWVSISRSLFLMLFKNRYVRTIYHKRCKQRSVSNYLRSLFFVEKYSRLFELNVLKEAEYIEHEIEDVFSGDNEKFAYARELLSKYAKAKFVVTSRIHCALPCLSLETPVLYVYNKEQDETSYCRMDGLIQLFNTIEVDRKSITSSIFKHKIDNNSHFDNKPLYKTYKEELINKCKDFIQNNG